MAELPSFYREDPDHVIPKISREEYSNHEYGRSVQKHIISATDAVVVDSLKEVFYLAKRIVHPRKDVWWFGGKRNPCETPHQSVVRCVAVETGLMLPQNRFVFLVTQEHVWATRAQSPQEIGCHFRTDVFKIELSPFELATVFLSPQEYDQSFGLRPFNREDIKTLKIMASGNPILDVYDKIFYT